MLAAPVLGERLGRVVGLVEEEPGRVVQGLVDEELTAPGFLLAGRGVSGEQICDASRGAWTGAVGSDDGEHQPASRWVPGSCVSRSARAA